MLVFTENITGWLYMRLVTVAVTSFLFPVKWRDLSLISLSIDMYSNFIINSEWYSMTSQSLSTGTGKLFV